MTNPEDLLAPFVPPPRSQRANYTLTRMQKLMEALGNPQESYPVIHVAGTSGKTSTCYYLAGLLQGNGLKVGLTVSPHVEHLGERIQINGQSLSNADFVSLFTEFEKLLPQGLKPTYFEVLVAFAFWYFASAKVDVAVIETGLGGLLDGTNVVESPGKVCIITDIGIDHTQLLGNTIPEIAAQKAGIIQPGNHAYMLHQSSEIEQVIRASAQKQSATLKILDEKLESEDLPLFQNRNFSLARQVAEAWLAGIGKRLTTENIQNVLKLQVPARMEVLKIRGKTVVLDGAHNPQKLEQLVRSFKAKFPGVRPLLLTAMLKSGDIRTHANVEQLVKLAPAGVITTGFVSNQDLKKTSVTPEDLATEFVTQGFEPKVINNAVDALDKALNTEAEVVLITGSLYLIFDLRPGLVS